jgi:hypothetical protein
MMGECMCDWQLTCSFTGFVDCRGCGGDQCICVCGGHAIECPGCSECPDQHDDDEDEGDAFDGAIAMLGADGEDVDELLARAAANVSRLRGSVVHETHDSADRATREQRRVAE